MDQIKVIIDRRCMLRGDVLEPGRTVALAPLDAAAVVHATKGRLADEADAPKLRAAIDADTKRAMRGIGGNAGHPPAPWQAIGHY